MQIIWLKKFNKMFWKQKCNKFFFDKRFLLIFFFLQNSIFCKPKYKMLPGCPPRSPGQWIRHWLTVMGINPHYYFAGISFVLFSHLLIQDWWTKRICATPNLPAERNWRAPLQYSPIGSWCHLISTFHHPAERQQWTQKQ